MADQDEYDDVEITTDEVLRSGEQQLRTSRDVLSMIDEALHKSRRVLQRSPVRTRDELEVDREDANRN